MKRSNVPQVGAAAAAAALVALLLTPHPAASQAEPAEERGGGGYFQAGYMMLDLDELNASLQAAGLPALDDGFVTIGGGGFGVVADRFLLGGEGHALMGSEETTPDGALQVSMGGGYGLFRLGYLAFSRAGFDVWPMIGLGGGGMNLQITERSAPTFEEVLANPLRSSSLSTGSFLLDVSVAAHYRILIEDDDPDPDDEDEIGGFLVGLQVGYTLAPGDPSWDLDVINGVAGGPDLRLQGLYVRGSIGGWGGRDER